MKKIFFDKYNSPTNFVLISIVIICFLCGFLDTFEIAKSIWFRRINALGYLLLLIIYGKMFVWKYYVSWNKCGMIIKLGSFFGKSFSFNKIAHTELKDGTLNIRQKDDIEFHFDLHKFRQDDIDRLSGIIAKHTRALNTPFLCGNE